MLYENYYVYIVYPWPKKYIDYKSNCKIYTYSMIYVDGFKEH